MNKVTINGKTFNGTRSVRVANSRVFVDGVEKSMEEIKGKVLDIKVEGTLESLEADGSVACDDVKGTVQAGGSVTCDDVGGNVQAGGSVTCDYVGGSVMAGGSVSHE